MNIGAAAKASGVSAKMIRYYESSGLIPKAARRGSGYRDYAESDVHRLTFVRRARQLGFSVEFIRELLGLWSDRSRGNADIRAIARNHVADLQAQAAKLQGMIETLNTLIKTCQRGERPDCPIMTELAGGAQPPHATEGRNDSQCDLRAQPRIRH